MLKIIFDNGTKLKNWINAINLVADEAYLKYDQKEGLAVRAMDPSQICMVDFKVPAIELDGFKVDKPDMVEVSFLELKKVCKRLTSSDAVELTIDKNVVIKAENKNATRKFSVGLLGGGQQFPKMPTIEFTSKAIVKSDQLVSMLKDADVVSTYVNLSVAEQMTLFAKGDSGTLNIEAGDTIKVESGGKTSANFSLEFLTKFAKCAKGQALIELRTDAPLLLSFNLDGADIAYFLAPRIES